MVKVVRRLTSGIFEESFEERSHLSKNGPTKSLVKKLNKNSGRDNTGQISIRHRGGGSKRKFRVISTLDEFGPVEAEVLELQYDPNRSANIALIQLKDGGKKYIIAPDKINVGDLVKLTEESLLNLGDRAKLKHIPVGSIVHNIQLFPNSKSAMVRAAGCSATLMALESKYGLIRLPSGELRRINEECFASFGQVSNTEHSNIKIGKAGRVRKMGIRPTVRGKAMYPAAHPHGGGEGVNPVGLKYPKTPWGKIAIGKRTRRNKLTGKYIVKRRQTKKR